VYNKDKKNRRSFTRRAKPERTTGVRALQEQSQPARAKLATAVAPLLLLRVFAAGLLFLFNVLSWDFFGGFLESIRGSFRSGLALKTPLGRNKVVRLGLYLGCILDSNL